MRKVIFNPQLQVIGAEAFDTCSNLEEIDLPSTIKYIGRQAFHKCSKLQALYLSVEECVIGQRAFINCFNLQEAKLEGVISIGASAFESCGAMHRVEIGEGLEKIGDEAFLLCAQLQEITLPRSIQHIGKDAFSYCDSLQKIIINADSDDEIARVKDLLPKELQSRVVKSANNNVSNNKSSFFPDGAQHNLDSESLDEDKRRGINTTNS